MADFTPPTFLRARVQPRCTAWAIAGVVSLALAVPSAVRAQQAYNPFMGGMQTQAAPRMAVATTAPNATPVGQRVNGVAAVTSAGVLTLQGRDIRLHGIVIPLERSAQSRASSDLIRMTKGIPVECVTVGTDTDGTTLGACGTDIQPNLALALIDAGRALVDRQQVANTPVADLYLDAERQARRADLGLWGPETGPIPVHTAGIARRVAPQNLSPPAPKPTAQANIGNGHGPVIRFEDGSMIDLSNPIPVPTLTSGVAAGIDGQAPGQLSASFVAPDMPATPSNANTGIGQSSFDAVQFNTFGLRDMPNANAQVASLDAALDLPNSLPDFGQRVGRNNTTNGNDSILLGLIGHLDDVIQRHRAAKERGELYLPTPPGEEPRTIPLPQTETSSFAWWRVIVFVLVGGLAIAGAVWLFRWHQGVWPWERPSKAALDRNAWRARHQAARNLAATLDQETLNLSFALSERADIARLASSKPSGRTASDLRALRLEMPTLISENWEEIGRFSRAIGLQARTLHTQLADYDRRVADLAALATEGRLHENSAKVFAALAVRLDELSTLSKGVHRALRQRLQEAPKAQRPRQRQRGVRQQNTHRQSDRKAMAPVQSRRLGAPSSGAGWADAARA